jgi:glycerophosphoryl diester phosphodiesterase
VNDRPIIVAHRGLHGEHAENSLEALLEAWRSGIEWCECDVRGSLEHEPFLLHDATLGRTTDGAGTIEQTPAETLHRLGLRRRDGSISPACVPRLKVAMEAMQSTDRLLIEIKPGVADEVVKRTLAVCDPVACVVQSFDRAILRRAEALRPAVRRMLLVDDANAPGALEPGAWEAVNARHDTLLPEHVETLRERGLGVGVWTTNEPADIRRAIGLRADMIITDRPQRALALLGALDQLRG